MLLRRGDKRVGTGAVVERAVLARTHRFLRGTILPVERGGWGLARLFLQVLSLSKAAI